MSRIAYVNGQYVPMRDAYVHVEDRGYQFADGVYEVCEIRSNGIVDMPRHLARLQRSLSELRIPMPMSLKALEIVIRQTVRLNRIRYGIVYLQITRGVARRDHAFPAGDIVPSIVITARSLNLAKNNAQAAKGVSVVSVAENRWPRVDIKTVGLLPNVLARQEARERGAYEAWYVDTHGNVTEGASCNAWIITPEGTVVTRSADSGILAGITRAVLTDCLAAMQLKLEVRPFTIAESQAAAEAFVTSASQIVMPVVSIDGVQIGNGLPGEKTKRLRQEFHRFSHIS